MSAYVTDPSETERKERERGRQKKTKQTETDRQRQTDIKEGPKTHTYIKKEFSTPFFTLSQCCAKIRTLFFLNVSLMYVCVKMSTAGIAWL